ncbi:amino acid adenylation domain-containing protein [Streptomyces sp. NPDC001840]
MTTSMTYRTVHGCVREVARRFPAALAVVDEHASMTYGEVLDAADKLGHALQAVAADDEQLVATRLARTRFVASGLLGVLSTGRGYVPIDPDYPPERRAYLLDDCRARIVLTDGALEPDETRLAEVGAFTLAARRRADRPGSRSPRHQVPDGTAYVIYTSGSTGAPKGCLVGHDNVLALLEACARVFEFRPGQVWTVLHSFSFDFSVWELWGALLNEGTAVIVPRHVAVDPESLVRTLREHQVAVVSQTPSAFGSLVDQLRRTEVSLPALRYLVLGGEAIDPRTVLEWHTHDMAPQGDLVNMYGITETTVHVTHTVLDAPACRSARRDRTPIGRPLPHLDVSLRDSDGRPVPTGTPGEIWVSGAGVASGYLGRPDLTRERFVNLNNPHTGAAERHYRSGDFAVRDETGNLHYIGRLDAQIKLRGHRVELGEIEAALTTLAGVRDAACTVLTNRSGRSVLVAHVVTEPDVPLGPDVVRAHLTRLLPAHMIPHRTHRVAALPVSANGKFDRGSLDGLPHLGWSSEGHW